MVWCEPRQNLLKPLRLRIGIWVARGLQVQSLDCCHFFADFCGAGIEPALRTHLQMRRNGSVVQRRQPSLRPFFLQSLTRHKKVLKSPRNAHYARTVSPEVQNLAVGSAHQVAAGAKAKGRIQVLHTLNQAKAGFLEKIVPFFRSTLVLTRRHAMGQPQVLKNPLISLLRARW